VLESEVADEKDKLLGGGLYRSGVEPGGRPCLTPYLSTTWPEGEGDTIGTPGCLQRVQIAAELPGLNRPPTHSSSVRTHPLARTCVATSVPHRRIPTGNDVATRIRPLGSLNFVGPRR